MFVKISDSVVTKCLRSNSCAQVNDDGGPCAACCGVRETIERRSQYSAAQSLLPQAPLSRVKDKSLLVQEIVALRAREKKLKVHVRFCFLIISYFSNKSDYLY